MKKMNNSFKLIKKEIKKAHSIALFGHRAPDMDCLGSMFALADVLESMGKEVVLFCADKLTLEQKALVDEKRLQTQAVDADIFDLFISVDVATTAQLGKFADYFTNFPLTIKIDHHSAGGNDDYALLNHFEVKSSCCEIIYELINNMGVKITPKIATYLYAGLSSDTYSFINTNTTLDSFKCAYSLIKHAANIEAVNNAEYRLVSRKAIAMKKVFYDRMKIYKEGFAICTISQEDLKENKADNSDCSSFSSEMLAIEGVNISCNILEKEKGVYALSLRSMKGYSANAIAVAFGGGGHIEASGATIESENSDDVIKQVVKTIQNYLSERGKDE